MDDRDDELDYRVLVAQTRASLARLQGKPWLRVAGEDLEPEPEPEHGPTATILEFRHPS
jgi:hypothetical protein